MTFARNPLDCPVLVAQATSVNATHAADTNNNGLRYATTYSSSYRPIAADLRRPIVSASHDTNTMPSTGPEGVGKHVTTIVVTRGAKLSPENTNDSLTAARDLRSASLDPHYARLPATSGTQLARPMRDLESGSSHVPVSSNCTHRRLIQPSDSTGAGNSAGVVWQHRPIKIDSKSQQPNRQFGQFVNNTFGQHHTAVASASNSVPTGVSLADVLAAKHDPSRQALPLSDTKPVLRTGDNRPTYLDHGTAQLFPSKSSPYQQKIASFDTKRRQQVQTTNPITSTSATSVPTTIVPYQAFTNLDFAHMFSQIARITDHLFLSSLSALSPDRLKQHGVTLLVTAMIDPAPSQIRSAVASTLHVSVEDTELASLRPHFDRVADRIAAERRRGGKALVHCAAGVSRSSSLVLAYLVSHANMSLAMAYQHVKAIRPCIQPNPAFWRQLLDYEERVRGSRSVRLLTHHPTSGGLLSSPGLGTSSNNSALLSSSSANRRNPISSTSSSWARSAPLRGHRASNGTVPSVSSSFVSATSMSRALPLYSTSGNGIYQFRNRSTPPTTFHSTAPTINEPVSSRRPASFLAVRQPLG